MDDPIRYSVIIPVYNEEEVIEFCLKEVSKVLKSLVEPYEIIVVNDGSQDHTAALVTRQAQRDPSIKLINLSRNFGHQAALSAGLDYAQGEAVIFIDADLQDPPEVIKKMITKWKQGWEVVYGQRIKRERESFFKKATAAFFYRFLRLLSGQDLPLNAGDFRLLDRKVYQTIRHLPEHHRYLRGLTSWVGFRQCAVPYERKARQAGQTKYPLWKMLRLATDAITSFSDKPLKVASLLGLLTAGGGFGYLIYSFIRYLVGYVVEGWTSLVALLIIFNGILFMILGVMGNYIGRIFEEVKGRPIYIVRDTLGFEKKVDKATRAKARPKRS